MEKEGLGRGEAKKDSKKEEEKGRGYDEVETERPFRTKFVIMISSDAAKTNISV